MDVFNIESLKELMQKHQEPCISIYMPTINKGAEKEQNNIRFKNLLRDTSKRLTERGLRDIQINEMLKPAKKLVNDTHFWNHQSEGFAVFIAPGEFRYYKLPQQFDEQIIVNTRFYIKPILPVITNHDKYFVLSLDKKNLRLFECTKHEIKQVELENVATSLQEALQLDEKEQLKFHTVERGANKQGVYNGPGFGTDDARNEKDIVRYFNRIEKGIYDIIKEGNPPLVLAGVEYLLPHYRAANSYPNLIENGVPVNTDYISESEIHKLSWEAVQPYFDKSKQDAIFLYEQLYDTERTSDQFAEIVQAANSNKIQSLFINPNIQIWGKFNPDTFEVEIHSKKETNDEDLCDLAVTQTIFHNGDVFIVDHENFPEAKPLAAVFRY